MNYRFLFSFGVSDQNGNFTVVLPSFSLLISLQWSCVKTEGENNRTWLYWQTTSSKRKKQTPWERNGEWQPWLSIVSLLGFISSLLLLRCLLFCWSRRDLGMGNCKLTTGPFLWFLWSQEAGKAWMFFWLLWNTARAFIDRKTNMA